MSGVAACRYYKVAVSSWLSGAGVGCRFSAVGCRLSGVGCRLLGWLETLRPTTVDIFILHRKNLKIVILHGKGKYAYECWQKFMCLDRR